VSRWRAETPRFPDIRALRARFAEHGQEHVLRFWDRLDLAAQRRLAGQVASLDLPALDAGVPLDPGGTPAAGKLEPPAVEALPERGGDAATRAEARRTGEALLRAGQVALMVVAGGQGSRLGFAGPKGLYPLGRSPGARCSRSRRSGSAGCASAPAPRSRGT
jgi:UDP-N-acetylglucosamine/UDP-N-acetylgalactosamine diphosphorylase